MTASTSVPEAGQLVSVRNRPALVTAAIPHGTPQGTTTLVQVDYLDGYGYPSEDSILWELEPHAGQLRNAGWPAMHRIEPDHPSIFRAYRDSIRWTSLQSVQSVLAEDDDLPLVSPWSAAVQIEDYQLTPLLKALSMPRVALLLADDVGLGKTIQAGLIATELIMRRRIKRMLIVCPASLQVQWQEEMAEKFHLDFTVLDSDEARRTQRELGSDVNPWTVHNRIITSMDYLRQEHVYQQFETSANRRQEEMGGAFAPWDLLIVDEAHNVAPRSATDESLRTRMMRRLTHWFEHRVFATATPHNGYTTSFSGLLELLDPFRFVQKPALSDTDHKHIDAVMVRRLKREINEVSTSPRFASRTVHGVPVMMTPQERALFDALRAYREEAYKSLAEQGRQEEIRGQFIFSLLTKRLLSCPYAFARTWWTHLGTEGFADEKQVDASRRAAEEDLDDDVEKGDRERLAAQQVGSWLLREAPNLRDPAEAVSEALRTYGWTEDATLEGPASGLAFADAKFDALVRHLKKGFPDRNLDALLGPPSKLADDERLILFTEYKDTLDYLLTRLEKEGYKGLTVRHIYGGMSRPERDEIKAAFNDEASPMRLLVATDAASEGLNLQRLCRYVAHYEIPWNPMRLEQRNGRVDRHGQPRDVRVFHYSSDEDADQAFLHRVVEKVHEARDDLGSVGTVIDEGIHQHFWGGSVDQRTLGSWVDTVRDADPAREDLRQVDKANANDFLSAMRRFEAASRRYDLSVDGIQNVVRSYLELHQARLEPAKDGYLVTGARPKLKKLLLQHLADEREAMPRLVFDPQAYVQEINGRPLYRPTPGTRLLRLGHPVTQAALGFFRRAMWGQEEGIHRWTMLGYRPNLGSEAYLQLQYLLTARNELQEVVHSTVGSWWFHVRQDGLDPLEDDPALGDTHELDRERMVAWWNRLKPPLIHMDTAVGSLSAEVREAEHLRLGEALNATLDAARRRAREDFDRRIKELKADMGETRRKRLERMVEKDHEDAKQLRLFAEDNVEIRRRLEERQAALDEQRLKTWDQNQEELRQRLESDHRRFVQHVLPKRYTLAPQVELVEVGAVVYVPAGPTGGTP